MTKLCPCGTGKLMTECCLPYIRDGIFPVTPEALMRSRYTAYVMADMDYIRKTMRAGALLTFNPKRAKKWAQQSQWLGLKVINAAQTLVDKGLVEFVASYKLKGQERQLHEISEFHFIDGRWYYVGGQVK